MYKSVELDQTPKKITVTFTSGVELHTQEGHYSIMNDRGTQELVKRVTINEPVSFKYHTYGNGIVTYYAEWFNRSVRPLKKHTMIFDTLQVESMKIENS